MTPHPAPSALNRALEEILQPQEETRWLGQPKPVFFESTDLAPVFFGLLWSFVAVAMTLYGTACSDWFTTKPGFRPQGIPLVLMGVLAMAAPVWRSSKSRHTVYVVTNLRAVILQRGRKTVIQSFWPEHLKNVSHVTNKDGTGSIFISRRISSREEDCSLRYEQTGILRIPDWQQVLVLLHALAKKPDYL